MLLRNKTCPTKKPTVQNYGCCEDIDYWRDKNKNMPAVITTCSKLSQITPEAEKFTKWQFA